jgi:RimK-like ATP-grasp domain
VTPGSAVLLCGVPSETPLAMVANALSELGHPFFTFNQRHFANAHCVFDVACGEVSGELRMGRTTLPLEQVVGVYTRLMDDRQLPEYGALPDGAPERARCRALHDALAGWMALTPARVVNPTSSMGSNGSKPYQAQLIARHGFRVPETIVTNDPDRVIEFQGRHGRLVYKSASGIRSIVRVLGRGDLDRLERIRWCPTQFQAYVEGTDVRVHVVDREVFATEIVSDATDYRYATREGRDAELRAVSLDEAIAARCLALARDLGLPFAGIDLRRTAEGGWVCFEVNPSPGFSFYEFRTGQPIARAVARYLVGRA